MSGRWERHPYVRPPETYPDFPSNNQAFKAGVPMARAHARREAGRPDPRGQLVELIAAGLYLHGGGGGDADPDRLLSAEELLARHERTLARE